MTRSADSRNAPLRLVVVDDSPFYRLRFAKMFGRSEGLTVVGVAADGEEAIRLIADERPDVVVLDLTMPRVDGFAVLRWAMSHTPVPIVVCSSRSDRESVFKALELGAVDYITKPESSRGGLEGLEALLVERVTAAARARIGAAAPAAGGVPVAITPPRAAGVIAVAASTGGPAAIQRLARTLPRELEVPIVVVQHMPRGFTRMFAERLDRHSHYAAAEARDGSALAPRTIHVAPGGMQTRLERGEGGARFAVSPRAAGDVHAPSADALFASAAEAFGDAAVGVILTGMGDDGSRGVAAVKARGGYVLVESSDSALIYGMPRAALATGCVDAQLPLSRMPEAFLVLARG